MQKTMTFFLSEKPSIALQQYKGLRDVPYSRLEYPKQQSQKLDVENNEISFENSAKIDKKSLFSLSFQIKTFALQEKLLPLRNK